MDIDERNEQGATYGAFRTSLDIGMGAIYIILGAGVLFLKQFGLVELSTGLSWVLGIMLCLYGGFRIYRGLAQLSRRRRPARGGR